MDDKSISTAKVLVAEDNAVVRKGLTNFLVKWGYVPIEVEDGDSALHQLEKDHSIRLAILDWNLPGLNGIQLCQRLRIRGKGPYVYIIMFSARKSKEEQIMALEGGADDYLVKPCKPAELRARLSVGRRIIETALPSCPASPPTTAAAPEESSRESPKKESGSKKEASVEGLDT